MPINTTRIIRLREEGWPSLGWLAHLTLTKKGAHRYRLTSMKWLGEIEARGRAAGAGDGAGAGPTDGADVGGGVGGGDVLARFVPPLDGVTLIAVTSLDGRAAIDGVSGGLGNPADAALLQAVRAVSDIVVVGAGTARAENYGPTAPPTRLAVLSRSFDVDPASRLFDDPASLPILIGGAGAPPERRTALAEAGATLVELSDTAPEQVLAALRRLGHTRIALEGGPGVYREHLRADVVDRAFLTLSPMMVGDGPATFGSRDATGASPLPLDFRAEAAAFSDSHLFVRYSRVRAG